MSNSLPQTEQKRESLRRLAQAFFDSGTETVYVVECCDHVFVGAYAPYKCRGCGASLAPVPVTAASEIDALSLSARAAEPTTTDPPPVPENGR